METKMQAKWSFAVLLLNQSAEAHAAATLEGEKIKKLTDEMSSLAKEKRWSDAKVKQTEAATLSIGGQKLAKDAGEACTQAAKEIKETVEAAGPDGASRSKCVMELLGVLQNEVTAGAQPVTILGALSAAAYKAFGREDGGALAVPARKTAKVLELAARCGFKMDGYYGVAVKRLWIFLKTAVERTAERRDSADNGVEIAKANDRLVTLEAAIVEIKEENLIPVSWRQNAEKFEASRLKDLQDKAAAQQAKMASLRSSERPTTNVGDAIAVAQVAAASAEAGATDLESVETGGTVETVTAPPAPPKPAMAAEQTEPTRSAKYGARRNRK